MLKQFHDYKSRHVADIAAWHRSYRSQLAEARAENCRLREQIWDMQAHAGHANESLRLLRKAYDDDKARWEQRVETKALRQEVRFWKRMACPEIDEGEGVWSDDDDVIDVAEKARLKKVAEEQAAALAATRAVVEAQERGEGEGSGSGGEEGEGGTYSYSMQQQPVTEQVGLEELKQRSNFMPVGGRGGGVPMQRESSAGPVPPPRPGSAASSTGSTGSTGQ